MTQPDTYEPESQGVQAWDRYAYVNNNPVNATDPTWHTVKEDVVNGCDSPSCRPLVSLSPVVQKPILYQTISGGITIGQRTTPGLSYLNYNSDYPGNAANSGSSEFYLNNYNPTVPCVGASCIPLLMDVSLRMVGAILPASRSEKPIAKNVGWNFTVKHTGGKMSPGDFQFWTTQDDAYLYRIELQNGSRTDVIRPGVKIDPRFGSENVIGDVPTEYSGAYPLVITFTIQCNQCVNIGQGPSAFRWKGQEIMVFINIH